MEKWKEKWRIKVNESKLAQLTFALRRDNCPTVKVKETDLPHQNV